MYICIYHLYIYTHIEDEQSRGTKKGVTPLLLHVLESYSRECKRHLTAKVHHREWARFPSFPTVFVYFLFFKAWNLM